MSQGKGFNSLVVLLCVLFLVPSATAHEQETLNVILVEDEARPGNVTDSAFVEGNSIVFRMRDNTENSSMRVSIDNNQNGNFYDQGDNVSTCLTRTCDLDDNGSLADDGCAVSYERICNSTSQGTYHYQIERKINDSLVEVWQYNNSLLKLITTFSNKGESEGCVYDDENRTLFISEENTNGVLKAYKLDSALNFSNPIIVDSRQGNIGGDPEGVAIYKTSSTSGYVVLSSQGDSKYNIYNREAPYEYINSFRIGPSMYGLIDGASDTDGVAISSNKLNIDFPQGLLVVQDGYNKDKGIDKNQNFKYVSFRDVLKKLQL